MLYCDPCALLIALVMELRQPEALVSSIKTYADCEFCKGPGPCNGVPKKDAWLFEYRFGAQWFNNPGRSPSGVAAQLLAEREYYEAHQRRYRTRMYSSLPLQLAWVIGIGTKYAAQLESSSHNRKDTKCSERGGEMSRKLSEASER
jgi:hypothetical protein